VGDAIDGGDGSAIERGSTRRRSTIRRRVAVSVVVALALVGAACSNSSSTGTGTGATPSGTGGAGGPTGSIVGNGEMVPLQDVPGVTDEEIRFSAFGTRSNNPLGTCVLDCYTDGIEAYFAWRNSEGGVNGRQMVLSTVLDDQLTQNQAQALEIVSADDTFAAFSATQVASGWGDIAEAGIPLYTWSIHPAEMTGREGVFGYTGVLCTACTRRAGLYPVTLAGATKVAALGYGVSPASAECASGSADTVEQYGAETGLEVAYENNELAFGLPNGIGPEVTAMKDAGVDFVMGCLDLNGMQTLAQEMERQGMADVPMFHPNTYDAAFVAEAGELFEGDYVGVTFRAFEADPAGTQAEQFQTWMAETGKEISELAMVGWINADLAFQGLVAAGPEFDREKVIAATNAITDFDAGGLIAPIDWSRQHVAPTQDDPVTNGPAQDCGVFVKVRDGKFELVGDPEKPFFCWDPTVEGWTEPEARSFG
jgi:ABC-type branched-subunit amino acid transport system substrate-binding protein